MSTSNELEHLQNRRTGLEEESRSLEEQQKNLEERVKILEEKIAIEQLEDNVQTRQNALKELESKISELEKRLKRPSSETEPFTPIKEAHPDPAQEMQQEEPTENYVEVTTIEDTTVNPQIEHAEDSLKQHEKKKRKLF